MDIGINEVKDMIESLESNGEISIKEEKYLKLAKLCVQLAEENVGLKEAITQLKNIDYQNESMDDVTLAEEIGFNASVMAMHRWVPKTPATDRILSGIKADGVDEFAAKLRIPGNDQFFDALAKGVALAADDFAKQLREGDDK